MKNKFTLISFVLLLFSLTFVSASFGFDNQNIPVLRPVVSTTSTSTNISGGNYTFNETQFDVIDDTNVSIKTSWLETFVNALSKWSNYWTKTENINQSGYNISADCLEVNGEKVCDWDSVNQTSTYTHLSNFSNDLAFSTFNATYDLWAYNQTTPFSTWLDSFLYNYNQTYVYTSLSNFTDDIGAIAVYNSTYLSTYNATYDLWAYNQTTSGGEKTTFADDEKLYFGDSNDSSIYYDRDDNALKINPQEVGSAIIDFVAGAVYANVFSARRNFLVAKDTMSLDRIISLGQNWLMGNKGTDLYKSSLSETTVTHYSEIPNFAVNRYPTPIKLEEGWNAISIRTSDSMPSGIYNVSLSTGNNLIGFPCKEAISTEDLLFNNGTASYDYETAIANGVLTSPLARSYNLDVAGGTHEISIIVPYTGYWVNVRSATTIIFNKENRCNLNGETFAYSDLRVSNGTDEKTIVEAANAGWLSSSILLYWGWSEILEEYTWLTIRASGGNKNTISPFEGVFIKSNIDNIYLIANNTALTSYDLEMSYNPSNPTDVINNPNRIIFPTSAGNVSFSGGTFESNGTAGITDSSSYWLCTASDCSSSCQVQIKGGIITGCT
jgi:hypothetical protein